MDAFEFQAELDDYHACLAAMRDLYETEKAVGRAHIAQLWVNPRWIDVVARTNAAAASLVALRALLSIEM